MIHQKSIKATYEARVVWLCILWFCLLSSQWGIISEKWERKLSHQFSSFTYEKKNFHFPLLSTPYWLREASCGRKIYTVLLSEKRNLWRHIWVKMSKEYERICAIIQTSCTGAKHVRNDVRNDYDNAHVAVQSSHISQHIKRRRFFIRPFVS